MLFRLLLILGGKEVDGEQDNGEKDQAADLADAEQPTDVDFIADVQSVAFGVQTSGDDGQHRQQDAYDTLTGDEAGGVQHAGLNGILLILLGAVLALFQVPAHRPPSIMGTDR